MGLFSNVFFHVGWTDEWTKWRVKSHIRDGQILNAYEIAKQIFPTISFWFHSPPTDDSFIIYSADH